MHRREMLTTSSAALLGLSAFPFGWVSAADGKTTAEGKRATDGKTAAEGKKKVQKLLYFTRSVEFEHSVVAPGDDGRSHSDKILMELGKDAGFEVECTKDGRVFDGELDQYDGIVTYLCGNQFQPSIRNTPPMTVQGRDRLLAAVDAGKPFVALHSACYWGRDAGADDPYIRMVGGEFISHGEQQEGTMKVVSPGFPGAAGAGDSFRLMDEWYALKSFARDLHVVLVQDTAGMRGDMYQRPLFPATWARMHGKGRVFFCSMGHREDVWTHSLFQKILLGGLAWALGNVDADVTPNIATVAPRAEQLTF